MAIVVVISGQLGRRLGALRRVLGVDGDGVMPAHVPLAGPFTADPPFLPLERCLWQFCHDSAHFYTLDRAVTPA